MNYAQKSLDLTTAALQEARITADALKALLDGPLKPQQITLTTAAGSVTAPLPVFEGEDAGIASTFYDELLNHAELRVSKLQADQLYWCAEVVLVDKLEKQRAEVRE